MGRAPAVLYPDVAKVANEMYAEGIKDPGGASIRERLARNAQGKPVGSLSSIQVHLETWRRVEKPADAPGRAKPLPDRLAADIQLALDVAQETGRNEVKAELKQARDDLAALAEQGVRLEEENADLSEALAQRTSERDGMQGQLADRTSEVERLREEVRVLQEQNSALAGQAHQATAAAQAAEGRVDEIRASTERQLDEMRRAINVANERAAQAAAEAVASDRAAVAAGARLEAAQEAAADARAQLAALQARLVQLQDMAVRAAGADATTTALREEVDLLRDTLKTVANFVPRPAAEGGAPKVDAGPSSSA